MKKKVMDYAKDGLIYFAMFWVLLTLLEKVPQASMITKPFGG